MTAMGPAQTNGSLGQDVTFCRRYQILDLENITPLVLI